MKLKVDHLGIAVEDLEAARERFASLLGIPPSPIETVPSEQVRVSFFDLGGCRIELLEPTGPASAVKKFLDKGRRGVHHLSLSVEGEDIAAFFRALAEAGVPVLGSGPGAGSGGAQVFFVRPEAAEGVLIEFTQTQGREKP